MWKPNEVEKWVLCRKYSHGKEYVYILPVTDNRIMGLADETYPFHNPSSEIYNFEETYGEIEKVLTSSDLKTEFEEQYFLPLIEEKRMIIVAYTCNVTIYDNNPSQVQLNELLDKIEVRLHADDE